MACSVASVPFRGCNCSDAAGSQYDIAIVQAWLRGSAKAPSPFQVATNVTVNLTDTGGGLFAWFGLQSDVAATTHASMYFNSVQVLAAKDELARQYGLLGVSMWNLDSIYHDDSSSERHNAAEMYNALKKYLG